MSAGGLVPNHYLGYPHAGVPVAPHPLITPPIRSSIKQAQLVLPNGEVTVLPIMDYSNSASGLSIRIDGRGLNNDVLAGGRGLMSMGGVAQPVGVVIGANGVVGVQAHGVVPTPLRQGGAVSDIISGNVGARLVQNVGSQQNANLLAQQIFAQQQFMQIAQMQYAMQAQAAMAARGGGLEDDAGDKCGGMGGRGGEC
ncbi:hypothetical protein TL16_g12215 [Triparma laevis f. inornata]|uniref:Uncharacterized protein n=1 Tax=Triparma laevis f. inornata TaxID=1714386 RepID=A0A9W7BKB9_9STRA|nr:hypothetical protein TL16_g12215 [Triparma laevis f. inornata]